jgi:hypothetical protein
VGWKTIRREALSRGSGWFRRRYELTTLMGDEARVFEAWAGLGAVRFKAPIHVRTGGATGFSRRDDWDALRSPFVFQTASVRAERDSVGRQAFKLPGYSAMPVKAASPGSR